MNYVYIITNLINGKKYIGMSINKKPEFRETYYGSGKLIRQAIKKYGKENFRKDIVKEFDNEEETRNYEKILIEENNAVNDNMYYNLTCGGYGGGVRGHIVTAEQREKTSKRMLGNIPSEETRKKISEKVKGYKWKKEDIKKRAEGIQKYWNNISNEEKIKRNIKISISSKGKICLPETKDKLSKLNSRLTKEQIFDIFENYKNGKTYKELSLIYGINQSSISAIILKKSYKWVWN